MVIINNEYAGEKILVMGCGLKYHDHQNAYTIDEDKDALPDMIASFGEISLSTLGIFPMYAFDHIYIENVYGLELETLISRWRSSDSVSSFSDSPD